MNKDPSEALQVEGELASCNEQLLALQKKLAETRLEIPRFESRLEAMTSSEPRLGGSTTSTGLLLGLSPQLLLATSLSRQNILRAQLEGLREEVQRREQTLTQEKYALIGAQRSATQVVNQRRGVWMIARSGLNFLASLLVVAILLGLMFLGIKKTPFLRSLTEVLSPEKTILIAALAILVLFLYQGFQVLGASLGAIALLLLLIVLAVPAVRRALHDSSDQ